jgi:hypothetical protein
MKIFKVDRSKEFGYPEREGGVYECYWVDIGETNYLGHKRYRSLNDCFRSSSFVWEGSSLIPINVEELPKDEQMKIFQFLLEK